MLVKSRNLGSLMTNSILEWTEPREITEMDWFKWFDISFQSHLSFTYRVHSTCIKIHFDNYNVLFLALAFNCQSNWLNWRYYRKSKIYRITSINLFWYHWHYFSTLLHITTGTNPKFSIRGTKLNGELKNEFRWWNLIIYQKYGQNQWSTCKPL